MGTHAATKRSSAKDSADIRVPVVGERVKTALDAAGYSEKQAARLLAERKLASISQPALNNICTGKAKTCRKSVRDGLAELCGQPVTSAWLGGEKPIEEGLFGPDWESKGLPPMRPESLKAVMLTYSLSRAWSRDRPNEVFPIPYILPALKVLLSPAFLRALCASKLGTPLGTPPSAEQDRDFAHHMSRAFYILLEPWLEGEESADWPAILGALKWLEREALNTYHRMTSEIESRRAGQLQSPRGSRKRSRP